MEVEVLPWDSSWWGTTTARLVTQGPVTADELDVIEARCARLQVGLLYFLCDGTDAGSAMAVQQRGFQYVDLRLTLTASLVGRGGARPSVRLAEERDIAQLRELAARSHRNSRFTRDGRLPQDRCDGLYAEWIEGDVHDPGTAVFIPDEPSITGYISAGVPGTTGEIALLAVDEPHRHRGLADDLVVASLQWMAQQGATAASVVTQGASVAAQRLYQRHGFRTREAGLWFHRWFDELSEA